VAIAREDDAVHVEVSDTGVGIPADVGDRVFEPYYRSPGGDGSSRWGSTGLGLALTKRLVDAHGGRIWFESGPGGTTFHVHLPLATTPAPVRT
jgi:signal transduction histidine kinase